jgi:TIR domain
MATRVFISYRREDSSAFAGRVADRLVPEFGREALFMDVDAVRLGVDFVEAISDEVAKCDVLLAVIGPNWLDARDEKRNRRLDDPNDFPRIEIAAALQRGIPVIPILIDGTKIPKAELLPKDLQGLAHRNALDVRNASFHGDIDRLIRELKGQSEQARATETPAASRSADLSPASGSDQSFGTGVPQQPSARRDGATFSVRDELTHAFGGIHVGSVGAAIAGLSFFILPYHYRGTVLLIFTPILLIALTLTSLRYSRKGLLKSLALYAIVAFATLFLSLWISTLGNIVLKGLWEPPISVFQFALPTASVLACLVLRLTRGFTNRSRSKH